MTVHGGLMKARGPAPVTGCTSAPCALLTLHSLLAHRGDTCIQA